MNKIYKFSEIKESKEGDLFSFLFELRDQIHIFHLKSNKYSEHIALNELYDSILNKMDEFIEVYQGQYSIINDYKNINISSKKEPLQYLLDSIDKFKVDIKKVIDKEDTHLFNIADEIISLIYRTIYKLKNLK